MGAATAILSPQARLADAARRLREGMLAPYIGPDLIAGGPVPATAAALAAEFARRVPLPSRVRGNPWGAAQFIEQRKHRRTLVQYMAEIFASPVAPTAAHLAIARAAPPLIVATWYDDAMAQALAAAGTDAIRIQGVTRALETRDVWTKAYGMTGAERAVPAAGEAVRTVLYEPHGSIGPAKNFLIADSDYVEVLTEIDIQSPIPDIVRARRATSGFLFLGCRFDDQMLRTYARQIAKRSAGGHVAVVALGELTRNETRFLGEIGAEPIDMGVAEATGRIAG